MVRRAMAIPSSSGMFNLAQPSFPSPLLRDRSWIEYFDANNARVMRSIRGSATVPDSRALLGTKPQQTVAKSMASKSGAKALSNGQLIKTDFSGAIFKNRLPGKEEPKKREQVGQLGKLAATLRM